MSTLEEPFDELMGVSEKTRDKHLKSRSTYSNPAIVSPEPSPISASTSPAFSGPPVNAFSHSSDRWSQYEKDGTRLREESDIATGRLAYSGKDHASTSVEVRLTDAGVSLPHPEEVKYQKTSGGFSFSNRRSQRDSETSIVYDKHDSVRAEALKVLEMAGDAAMPRRSQNVDPEPAKRLPTRMSGISFTNKKSSSSRLSNNSDVRYTIDDADSDDNSVENIQIKNADESPPKAKSWSSRYQVSQNIMDFTAGHYIDTVISENRSFRDKVRTEKSPAKLFNPSQQRSKHSLSKIFGSGINFSTKSIFAKRDAVDPMNVNLKSLWMDVDLQSNGNSLSLPPFLQRNREPLTQEQALKRRRIWIGIIVVLAIILIVSSILGSKTSKNGSASPMVDSTSAKFYVTADVPYDSSQESKIIRDIETIPSDADFVVHLGNIQDASVTLCPQQAYISANAILGKCASPVFVLPGPNDWTNCPRPDTSLRDWQNYLGNFERNFVHSFGVSHQLGNEENFSFIVKNVLVIGLHLVGGRRHDKEEWRIRHAKNVRWVKEQLIQIPPDKYNALLLLANARPSQQHEDFFPEIFGEINSINKPVLYVHADSGNGMFEQYSPFKETPNLIAIQIKSGGTNPPVVISVGKGSNPFVIES
jgi:hypothetical protein